MKRTMAARPPMTAPTTGPMIELFDDGEEGEAEVDDANEVDDDNVDDSDPIVLVELAAEVVLVAFPLRPASR